MIKRFVLHEGALAPTEQPDGPVELYVNPSDAERDILRQQYGLDEHALASALDPDEVARLETRPDGLFAIWKRPKNFSAKDRVFFDVASIGFVLSRERLAVIATEEIQLSVVSRVGPPVRTPLDVLVALVYGTIRHYIEHLKVIRMIGRDLQEKINTEVENQHLLRMFNLSESLIYYINAISSNGVVLSRLRSQAEAEGRGAEVVGFVDDVIVENTQCLKQAEVYSMVFTGLMDARGNLVNNNMNVLLRNLTIINVIFLPLNLLASIGGMSEYSMMTRGADWRISYAAFLVGMIGLGWVTLVLLRRGVFSQRAWMGRRRTRP